MAQVSGSTSSSMTSTSHTMTAEPTSRTLNASNSSYSTYAKSLLQALQPENRYKFIAPEQEICEGALDLAKTTLDGFAARLYDEQAKRIEEERKDRKRKRGEARDEGELLKIRKVHTQGFAVDQVWEQARRVIDALRGEVGREMADLEGSEGSESESESEGSEDVEDKALNGMKFDEDGFEIGSEGESAEDDEGQDVDGDSDIEVTGIEGEEDDDENDEEGLDMDGPMEGEDDYEDEEDDEDEEEAEEYIEDPHGLNDGFFSIDQFNKETEFLEQQDAAADPFTGEASDEEEIDWDADPMDATATASKDKKSDAKGAEGDEEADDDEGGPTFGNMDLNAPEGDSDEDEDEEMEDIEDAPGDNTNEVLYKDFFQPPARKVTKAEMQASYLARQEKKAKTLPEEEEGEMDRAMADVRRDLFDDESDDERSEDALSDVDAADPKSRRSAHERRQAKLAEEIRRLEAASVAKREWTLSGEARAADRPLNSLLEEDLDFERTGKPIPVITAEVSESIEELIKRRIIAQEFDEVIRRRPDSDSVPDNARRGAFELDDNKAQKSLAEMYEEDHIKANNPDTYMSQADDKLKKQHQEIEGLWKEVSAKLDALSSWHYKPKPPAPSLTVVSDIATVSMEDAQPTMASGISGADSMLAPQEIYKAGKDKHSVDKGEVVHKNGAPVAREEMTREEKLRRRRREKERIKKRGGEIQNDRPEGKKAMEKRETVAELKKAGVKVIGKRGDIKDIEGNKVKAAQITNGAGGFKL